MPRCTARSSAMGAPESWRGRLERGLRARWFGGVRPGGLLRGLAWVYGLLMRCRRWAYRHGLLASHAVPLPVVVVGNRTAGGAGKTPTVIALVEGLRARGWRPGVVSRGYGRSRSAPARVSRESHPDEVGDEPLLVHRATGVPVEVDVDRVAAARRLHAAGCDVVVADDGLQHLRLRRRVEIEVRDARDLGNGLTMPAGPLREPLPARAADACLVHGREPREAEVPLHLRLGPAHRVGRGHAPETRPLAAFSSGPCHAIAGIGDPPRFFAALRSEGLAPIGHAFPDHHAYTADDLKPFVGMPLLMTGKDAVKCQGLPLPDAWEVALQVDLPAAFLDALDQRLRADAPDAMP